MEEEDTLRLLLEKIRQCRRDFQLTRAKLAKESELEEAILWENLKSMSPELAQEMEETLSLYKGDTTKLLEDFMCACLNQKAEEQN